MSLSPREVVEAPAREWRCYPEYRDSGVEWLDEIPSHWRLQRMKTVVSSPVTKGHGVRRSFVALEHIKSGTGALVDQYEPEIVAADDYVLFEEGDVLFGKLRPYLRKYWMARFSGCCPTELLVLRPRGQQLDRRFLYYSVQSPYFVSVANGTSYGVKMPRTSWEILGGQPVPVPSLLEQRAIAAFLDQETQKIDDLIAKRERLIGLLEEKRTALISRAVTKGLDPGVPMKDSGVEWLGEIPEHWKTLRMKRVAKRVQTGSTPPTVEIHYYENGTVPWFGPGSFSSDLMLDTPVKLISETAIHDGAARLFESGSTMIVTIGATIGKVGYIETPASSNQQITGVTFDAGRVVPKFAAYQTKRLEPVLRGIAPNTTLPILDQQEVGDLPFCCPPFPQQQAIVNYIDRETSKIDALVGKVREHIQKLREYRTTLISATVTGKIDVRTDIPDLKGSR